MNKRQRKKHGVKKLPGRRKRTDCTVTESCGNVFKDLGLPDADNRLKDARASVHARHLSRRTDRIKRNRESQD